MHVVALVRADPRIIRDRTVGEVSRKFAEVDDVGHARGVGLDVLIGDKWIMFALVELVAAGMVELRSAKRERLHICLPRFIGTFELIHNVRNVDRDVVVVRNAVR